MRDALPLFNMLKQKFSSSIERDPMFNEVRNFFYTHIDVFISSRAI